MRRGETTQGIEERERSVESNWLSKDGGSISVKVTHRPKRKDILVRIKQGDNFVEVAMDYMHAETIADCIHEILEYEMKKVEL